MLFDGYEELLEWYTNSFSEKIKKDRIESENTAGNAQIDTRELTNTDGENSVVENNEVERNDTENIVSYDTDTLDSSSTNTSNSLINDLLIEVTLSKINQTKVFVSGIIKDSKGLPMSRATIMIKGVIRAQTDFTGYFELNAELSQVLEISFFGYQTTKIVL